MKLRIKTVNNNLDRHTDMPKIHSPFEREKNENGDYVVIDKIAEGYEWVFEDDSVMAVEKLHGTNVSVVIEDGHVTAVYNRTGRVPAFNKGKHFITRGILNAMNRGYLDLPDGQWFGELIGPKLNNNPHNVEEHIWIPFKRYAQKRLVYKSWGDYPKTFDSISKWFKEGLFSLFNSKWHGVDLDESSVSNGTFCEGIIFTHPDGRMAKLRRDMFDWYEGRRH